MGHFSQSLTYKGRPIEITAIEISGRSRDVVDAYVSEAHYTDTEELITSDEELNELTDMFPEVVAELHMENAIDAAEAAYDAYRDGTY